MRNSSFSKKNVFLLLLITCFMSCAVNSLEPLALARMAYHQKDYANSIRHYQQMIDQSTAKDRGMYYFELAACYIEKKEADQAIDYLNQAFKSGWLSALGLAHEVKLKPLQTHAQWPQLLKAESKSN